MEGLGEFVQLTGVGLAGLTVYFQYKLVTNHLDHNTRALEDIAKVMESLKDWLEEHKKGCGV